MTPNQKQQEPQTMTPDQHVEILRDTTVALVRRDGVDLSSRQMAVFLTCHLDGGNHTVRGLAEHLNVSKPAITRALDRLEELDLVLRKEDPSDRRSVLVKRTPSGAALLREIRKIVNDAVSAARKAA
jgi:DNA-binding MarR family transcriptional regulator